MTDRPVEAVAHLSCGCVVVVRDGEPVGRADREADAGEPIAIRRRCVLHGDQAVVQLSKTA